MTAPMLVAALLGMSLTQAFAVQTVDIDALQKVAYLKTEDGLNSRVTVLDYNLGVVATRLLSNQNCVVMMMNREVIPTLEHLREETQNPPRPQMSYSLMNTPMKNAALFGKQVEQLCAGVPSYYAEETERTTYSAPCETIITILGVTICMVTLH
ncbi:gastrokine-1-like [Lissotriton helveticus]